MKKRISLFLFILISVGCSSKFAYDNLDWVSYWYLDDFIDLNDSQSEVVKAELSKVLEWHRVSELPQYSTTLPEIKVLIEADQIVRVDWHGLMDDIRSGWERLRAKVIESSVMQIPTLSHRQLEQLFLNLEVRNKEQKEEVSVVIEERARDRYEKLVDTLERFMGDLTEQQALLADLYIGASFDTRLMYLSANAEMQRDIRQALDSYLDNPSTYQLVLIDKKLNSPDQYRSDQLKAYSLENRVLTVGLLRDLANTLTTEQKLHLLVKLEDWIELIDSLVKQ